ncbi:flagellar hook-associated protein FlgK [Nitratireductor basaltis]|uniref:Flagellar hook-associated protein 1 n=1 Tax=Nitratireductor basaltis TaxID=472175 RepID=A0A084U889_9HYPH|nr:flagellar hook-associated protein FlgK [Nitratireductor basaltis]KFB09175.1 Flagellar hook-associated protein FlgK [Nitratireductor basaltis]
MSLTSALSIAQSALFNTSRQTSVVSRNISEASNPDYARRTSIYSSTNGGARISEIRRATNEALFRQNLSALSGWQAQASLSSGLNTLQLRVNGPDNSTSPAQKLGVLQEALQTYAATPSNATLAENAVEAARGLVRTLNNGTQAIQSYRAEIDAEIKTSVDDLNRLLAEFETVNKEVVKATRAGSDAADALDARDNLLKKISEYVPVSTVSRQENDMMVLTADGATLFETVARPVTFTPNTTYTAAMTGNAIYVDGVPLSAGTAGNTTSQGTLAAKLQMRDTVAPQMQRQLDETARGLIEAFAETDASGTNPLAGLFTWPGGPALPASGTLVEGLAGRITVNAAVDSEQGGNVQLLRDGGMNGAAYVKNTSGAASYSDTLIAYTQKLDEPIAFDPAAGIASPRSLTGYTADSIGWLEALRQDAARGAESKEALSVRTATALSNEIGVNMDEEMALLLELEHSYEASARLMSVVDEMLATLMSIAR